MFRPLRSGQLVVDIVLPSVLFVLLAPPYLGRVGLYVLVLTGMCVALVFRRLSPTLALAIAWFTAIVQMLLMLAPDPANFAILAILYSAAAYGSNVVRWVAFGSAFAGAALVALYTVVLPAFVPGLAERLSPWSVPGDRPSAVVALSVTIFFVFLATFALAWTAGVLVRTWRKGRESRAAQMRAERDVVVEQERNRIARDMHDVVAHSLAVVIAQADGARYALAADPESADRALRTIAGISREALADVRVLLGQLRYQEQEGPQPVMADLGRLYEQMRGAGVEVDVRTVGQEGPVATGSQLAVYRIVQEALTNALRHGQPGSAIEVHFDWTGPNLQLWVVNAFDPMRAKPGLSHGLAGMNERASLVGGRFAAGPSDGRFVAYASIPRTAEAALA
ncbi:MULTISPECIES: sensor histidine kinase [unclassified Plantibacter]|uniref:sensor histidine kinase n=1 Tax=unclassified Plantibacter TaxID=2624265 RepID=UPI003D33E687